MRNARCVDCGQGFGVATTTGPLPARCESCRLKHKKDRGRERQAKWKAQPEKREQARLYLRAYHQAHKDDPEYRRQRREAKVLFKFGITQAELNVMLEAQNNLCAICGNGHVGVGTRLHIDHCHDSGRIRGLLCGKCNTAVGLLDDSPERAEQLAAYLRR